jgi:hypothetical protein
LRRKTIKMITGMHGDTRAIVTTEARFSCNDLELIRIRGRIGCQHYTIPLAGEKEPR